MRKLLQALFLWRFPQLDGKQQLIEQQTLLSASSQK
jgi:hypothetical protein